MIIKDGKIIVVPSVELIAKLYAEGFRESAFKELFGFKSNEAYKILCKYLSAAKVLELQRKRKKIMNI